MGKREYSRKTPLEQSRGTNKLDPNVTPSLGIEPPATLVGGRCRNRGDGKTGILKKILSEQSRGTNKLDPYVTPSLGIGPEPHWWQAGALINYRCTIVALLVHVGWHSTVGLFTPFEALQLNYWYSQLTNTCASTSVNDFCFLSTKTSQQYEVTLSQASLLTVQ